MNTKYTHINLRLLICISVFIFFNVSAQTPKLDSLKKLLEIQTTEDTLRANTLLVLTHTYLTETNDIKKVHETAIKLLTLSEKLGFKQLNRFHLRLNFDE